MGIMEPRVMLPNIAVVEEGLGMRDWTFFSNVYHGPLCRIMIGWNSNLLEVTILSSGGQWVTCDITRKDGGQLVRVTFVYGSSTSVERQELWHYLKYQKSVNESVPWLRARFKFLNLWADQEGYEEIVRAAWGTEAHGNPFSRLTSKLRTLKGHLSNFHKRISSHISSRVAQAEKKWKEAQDFLDRHPQDLEAGQWERDMELGSIDHLYPNPINTSARDAMIAPVTREDIKSALFSIPDDKAPGTDGYNKPIIFQDA
ncbi:hypothetical protein OIU78_018264 [Salix suchowensis]|nr:hypothetical protein OIU78_018264 [Salix suchowensis]